MTEYETIYITHPEIEETSRENLAKKLKDICSTKGAHLLGFKDWGVRKLSHEIAKQRRGHYFFVHYVGGDRLVPEVERNLRFDEKVLRFLTVRSGEVEDVEKRLEEIKQHEAAVLFAKTHQFNEGEGSESNDMDVYGPGMKGTGDIR